MDKKFGIKHVVAMWSAMPWSLGALVKIKNVPGTWERSWYEMTI